MERMLVAILAAALLSACMQQRSTPQSESVPSADYERCLDAEKMGGGERITAQCGKLSEEIERVNN